MSKRLLDCTLVTVLLTMAAAGLQSAAGQEPEQSPQTATEAASSELTRDDFNGEFALPWDVRRADPTAASLAKRPGFLTITTQEGDVIGTRHSAKNLYLIHAPRPFTGIEITTCIDGFVPQAEWNQAGLLCFHDDDNYVGPADLVFVSAVG